VTTVWFHEGVDIMRRLVPFAVFLYLVSVSAIAAVKDCQSLNAWKDYKVPMPERLGGGSVTLYAYQRWPSYLPKYYLDAQVVVLNGGRGVVDCNADIYGNIGSTASYYWRQAIMVDFDYFAGGRNTLEKAAAHVVETLNYLVDEGYLRSTFYLMGGSAGTAIMSAGLDYNPTFVKRVERAIFVSGPFTDIERSEVLNPAITTLMDHYNIARIDSLDITLPYNPNRYNQWIKPIMDKKGLRFFVAEDDFVFCGYPNACMAGNMDEEFLDWLSIATDDTETRESLENLGILHIYPRGGHNLFSTHPELLHDALKW
jgi:pimeloyl-ACP methyl ester carboxylesterase